MKRLWPLHFLSHLPKAKLPLPQLAITLPSPGTSDGAPDAHGLGFGLGSHLMAALLEPLSCKLLFQLIVLSSDVPVFTLSLLASFLCLVCTLLDLGGLFLCLLESNFVLLFFGF